MNTKLKSLGWIVPAILYTVTTSQSYAADTVCTLITKTVGSSTATVQTVTGSTTLPSVNNIDLVIAVASNFYYPAVRFVTKFVEQAVPSNALRNFGVCHNATGHLNQEIRHSGHPAVITGEWLSALIDYNYGLFLSANTSTPDALYDDGFALEDTLPYAMGVPTFYIRTGETVSNYIESVGSGPAAYYRGSTSFGPARLKPAASPFALAFPTNAPYGVAAINVITAMGNWPSPAAYTQITGSTVSGSCGDALNTANPLEIKACAYDNVDLSKLAIENSSNVKAGWTSWQQMFDPVTGAPPDSSLQFYTFPDYQFAQGYVPLDVPSSFSREYDFESWAYELTQFMKWADPDDPNSILDGDSWNEWLASNGYGAI